MRNPYLKNLKKIEFVITDACTGRCKHCSQGEKEGKGKRIHPEKSAEAVRKIAREYEIQTVMVFGGEPLLHPEALFAILSAAKEEKIPHRQVITNGFFTKSREEISAVAQELFRCGVNDLLLSVDAFHQETIPVEPVMEFALACKEAGIPVRLQPAWLLSPFHKNPFNEKTKKILEEFSAHGFPQGEGNVIFFEGNALKYLGEYMPETLPENPYVEDPRDVRCISFSPDGSVLDGNFDQRDIMEIISSYKPETI